MSMWAALSLKPPPNPNQPPLNTILFGSRQMSFADGSIPFSFPFAPLSPPFAFLRDCLFCLK